MENSMKFINKAFIAATIVASVICMPSLVDAAAKSGAHTPRMHGTKRTARFKKKLIDKAITNTDFSKASAIFKAYNSDTGNPFSPADLKVIEQSFLEFAQRNPTMASLTLAALPTAGKTEAHTMLKNLLNIAVSAEKEENKERINALQSVTEGKLPEELYALIEAELYN
jgi:hypothetical protein